MEFFIVAVVIFTSMIQSIFGVGVLLFGTPLLLMGGSDFASALTVLLPISLVINLFQIFQSKKQIDYNYYKKFLLLTMPPVVLFLILTIKVQMDVSIYVGIFLLFVSLKSVSTSVEKSMTYLFSFDKSYFVIQGTIHGLTNLGGSLLTSKLFSMNISKEKKRATISLSYFTFALFQIITLAFLGELATFNFLYMCIGAFIFVLMDYFVYKNISTAKYDNLFAGFLFCTGLILIVKASS